MLDWGDGVGLTKSDGMTWVGVPQELHYSALKLQIISYHIISSPAEHPLKNLGT